MSPTPVPVLLFTLRQSCQAAQAGLELVTLLFKFLLVLESHLYSLKASVGNAVFHYTYFSIDFYETKGG